MDEDERLLNATRWRRSWKTYRAANLGKVARQLMDERISPQQARFQADSPSYVYELKLCSSELLEELQWQCPKARLTKIKLVVA
jgi:hypothetical protein